MDFPYLKQKIGIIGGGQLGKMMILEAKKLGFYVTILDPSKDCPASSICDEIIVASFDDKNALLKLATCSDIITYEFEHIDYSFLIELYEKGHKIFPNPYSLKIIQNKYTQKCMLRENNVPVPDFHLVSTADDVKKMAKKFSYPLILKACTGGYDGKGNFVIKNEKDIEVGIKKLNPTQNIALMVEKYVDFSMEISVLSCGDTNKNIKVYPVCQNIHIDNILHKTIVPADISEETTKKALKIAYDVVSIFNGVGMFCTEIFVTKDGDVLLNEVAPRPHNSGHYTIEGCITSQFANHIRAVASLPLGNTSLINPTAMINLLGEDGHYGDVFVSGLDECLKLDGVSVHIYGKTQTKPKRKMGHITCSSKSLCNAEKNIEKSFKKIKFISK